ncbi:putative Zinc finger, Rad18-type [Medicago truncatula]|uniref:Putative Zinc finger, Rad18-type n=1 Tax=Medicago truncatula TaxID=3880 RepID=G7K3E0_MEDTR|nr:uncharacterized protein LOC11435445 [Medicago truncatula]AET00418.1 hypothetical protein MTR_5g091810 [Medicago truncatula]RHN57716.1 putative Zinc finger, Rad18-type [Medicago truncatula]
MDSRFDGFSIREYTSKMRSIDVFKCWPFTSTSNPHLTRDQLHSWLPPMSPCPSRSNQNHQSSAQQQFSTIQSSKSDHPVRAEDDEKVEMICPVCREFNAATLTAVNAHIDGCLAESVRVERRHMRIINSKSKALKSFKSKSKSPKKRSIAEIFKVEDKDRYIDQQHHQEKEKEAIQNESVMKLLQLPPEEEDVVQEDEVSITVRKFRWLSQRLEALRSKPGGGESAKESEKLSIEEEKLEMICPVCKDFNAATVTAVNAHIDSCLGKAVRDERRQTARTGFKSKPKAPKKRSIAEILNVVPPIEFNNIKSKTVEVEEDEDKFSDYSGEESSASDAAATFVSITKNKKSLNKNSKNKKMKKTKKKTMTIKKMVKYCDSGVLLNNEVKTKKKMNMKKKKKMNIFNSEFTRKKESANKREVQTDVNSCRKLRDTIGDEMGALQDIEPSVHRKKLGLNGLSVEKKPQVKNYNSVGKWQKADSPVRGIFRNHLKHVSGKISNACKIQDGTEESDEYDQVLTSDRHVKFSYKDEIVGPEKRYSFDETMFSTSSDALATSFAKEQSSGTDEECSSFEANKNYDQIALNIEVDKREEVCPITESKQFSCTLKQVMGLNFLKPCINQEKANQLEQKSELLTKMAVYDDNNSQLLDGGNITTVNFSKPLSAVQEGQMCAKNIQVSESGDFSFGGKFIDYSEDPTFQVDIVNKNASTKTLLEPSSSYSAPYGKVNEKPESPSPSSSYYGDNGNSNQTLDDKQLDNMFPEDMIDKSYPFSSWGQGCIRNSCLDPNFFGLPLNSHGELINFSSNGNVGMDKINFSSNGNVGTNQLETSSPLGDSLSGLSSNNILCQSSQENLSINERHFGQKTLGKDGPNSLPNYPPRLAVTELCSQTEDIHPPNSEMCSSHHVQPLHSEFLKHNSCVEQNQRERVQNHNRNGMVSLKEGSDHISPSSSQPTMRLMGKDVPIARSSQEPQQFTGVVWSDEESKRRHYAEYTALENSLLQRCSKPDWVSGSSLQISTDSVLQSEKIQSTHGLQSTQGFPQQFTDMQSNHVSQNGSLGVGRNAGSYFNSIAQESTSYTVYNGTPNDSSEQFIAGSKPSVLCSRPQVLPTPCNFNQPTCSRNGELNGRNKNPHVTKSAFGFPFLQPAANEQAKTYWSQGPYRSDIVWLSSSTDDMLSGTYSQQFSGVANQSFPQNRWGNNFITPSPNHSTKVLYSSNPLISRGPMKTTPLCPASIVQSPQASVTHTTMNNVFRNINKAVDRVMLDGMVVKDHHHPCTNIRKRPADNLDDSRKPIKVSNIEVRENMSRMPKLTRENSNVELQCNKRAVVLDPQVEIARSRCCQNVAQNLNPTSYPAVDSFKPNGTIRSSPVRLGPKRAKHILKSS